MNFGNINGLLHGQWKVVEDSGAILSAATSYTFSSLKGNTSKKYMLIARFIGNNSANAYNLTFNSDTGANYGEQYLRGQNTTISGARNTNQNNISEFGRVAASLVNGFSVATIHAESGKNRIIETNSVREANNSTLIGAVQNQVGVWNNSSDEINSITITADQANGIGIGSHFILLELVDASGGIKTGNMIIKGSLTGCWERIFSNTVLSDQDNDSASGLDGDNDQIYMLNIYHKTGSVGASNSLRISLNADTANNYGFQSFYGSSTSTGAQRNTSQPGFLPILSGTDTNEINLIKGFIYANSGNARFAIFDTANEISGTTVEHRLMSAAMWSNTVDNITSIALNANQTNGVGQDTFWEIYRLNL